MRDELELTEEETAALESNLEEIEVLPKKKDKVKNWMRNKPCLCKSGKKFKKCCMHRYI